MEKGIKNAFFQYILHLADNKLILGQRLGEWCGHGPVLEQDIALTNIALDLVGQARLLFQMASRLDEEGRNEDQLAFLRKENAYLNNLLVEQPNDDFAHTIVRQFYFDVFHYLQMEGLLSCSNDELKGIAQKSLKEIRYHLRYSSEWMERLGDGTEESHQRMQVAVDNLWRYTLDLFEPVAFEKQLFDENLAPDPSSLYERWHQKVTAVMDEAQLTTPEKAVSPGNGKTGHHTEPMGYLLAEMQYMQRTYPGLEW